MDKVVISLEPKLFTRLLNEMPSRSRTRKAKRRAEEAMLAAITMGVVLKRRKSMADRSLASQMCLAVAALKTYLYFVLVSALFATIDWRGGSNPNRPHRLRSRRWDTQLEGIRMDLRDADDKEFRNAFRVKRELFDKIVDDLDRCLRRTERCRHKADKPFWSGEPQMCDGCQRLLYGERRYWYCHDCRLLQCTSCMITHKFVRRRYVNAHKVRYSTADMVAFMLIWLGDRGSTYMNTRRTVSTAPATIHKIIGYMCLYVRYRYANVINFPTKLEDLRHIAERWQAHKWCKGVPNLIGSVDGKYFKWVPPAHYKAWLKNHKDKECGILVIGIVDSGCRFLYANVGNFSQHHDDKVFNMQDKDNIVGPSLRRDRTVTLGAYDVPFALVGDSAFTKAWYMMSPYDRDELVGAFAAMRRIWNRWIVSWPRKAIEAAWGRVVARFQRFRFAVCVHRHRYVIDFNNIEAARPKPNMHDMVYTALILHNMCLDMGDDALDYDLRLDEIRVAGGPLHRDEDDGLVDAGFDYTFEAVCDHLAVL